MTDSFSICFAKVKKGLRRRFMLLTSRLQAPPA